MKMKISLKHDTLYAQHFTEAYPESFQASEMELFAKKVNDLKPLKIIIAKSSTLDI